MKKIYSFLAIACTTLSLSAGEALELTVGDGTALKATAGLTKTPVARGEKALNKKLKKSKAKAAAKAPEAQDWASIGTGIYLEDLFTNYSNIDAGWHWDVEIETSASNPGWYRLQPYSSGPISEMMEYSDPSYMYINASDPSKVYAEDFTAFDNFYFSQIVVENEWEDADDEYYGVLKDGAIRFPKEAFAQDTGYNWVQTSLNSGVVIYLPGTPFDYKDYTFSAYSEYCGDSGESNIFVTAGEAVASYKALIEPGYVPSWDASYEDIVLEAGEAVDASVESLSFTPTARGIYTVLLVALNAENEPVGNAMAWTMWNEDNDEDWQDYGTCTFTDGIYTYGYSFAPEELTVAVQEHKTRPGYFRIANPYADHSELSAVEHTTHTHYLYINATDPEYTYIEPSVIGAQAYYGNGAIFSLGYLFYDTEAKETAKSYGWFGTYDKDTDIITFPEENLAFGEETWENGAFSHGANDEMSFALTKTTSGILDITEGASDSAPVEYFNLQGMRVDAPAAGSILIRRQGTRADKIRF